MSVFPEPVDSLPVIQSKASVWDRIRAYSVLLETLLKRYYPETFREDWVPTLGPLVIHDKQQGSYSILTEEEAHIIKRVRNYATHPEGFAHRVPTRMETLAAEESFDTAIFLLRHILPGDLREAIDTTPGFCGPPQWENVEEKYDHGSRHTGKVVYFTRSGVLVELEPGIMGRVDNSQISWTEPENSASESLSIGDPIEVQVLGINKVQQILNLSIKQLVPNPWEKVAEKYPAGTIVKGTVTTVCGNRIGVEIENCIRGVLSVANMNPVQKAAHASKAIKPGEKIEIKIHSINLTNGSISLRPAQDA